MSVNETPTPDRQDGFFLPTSADADIDTITSSVEEGQQHALQALADRTAMLADALVARVKKIDRYQGSIAVTMPSVKYDPSEIVVDIDHPHKGTIRVGESLHSKGFRSVSFRSHYLWIINDNKGISIVRPSDVTTDKDRFWYKPVTTRDGLAEAPLSNLPYDARQELEWDDLMIGDLVAPMEQEISFVEASPQLHQRVTRLVNELGDLSGLDNARVSGTIDLVAGQLVDEFGFVRVTPAVRVGEAGQFLRLDDLGVRVADPVCVDNEELINTRYHRAADKPAEFSIQWLKDLDLALESARAPFHVTGTTQRPLHAATTHAELFTKIHDAAAKRLAEMIRETHQHVTALD